MQAEWANVILAPEMKRALIDDHLAFFAARDTYARLRVPWKRGVIYHGPPGNGKTISIKATMHMLYDLATPVPTLYVRSLSSVRDIAAVSLVAASFRPLIPAPNSTKALSIQSNRSSARPASSPPATWSSRTWTRSSTTRSGVTSSTRWTASRATTASLWWAARTTSTAWTRALP